MMSINDMVVPHDQGQPREFNLKLEVLPAQPISVGVGIDAPSTGVWGNKPHLNGEWKVEICNSNDVHFEVQIFS